MPIDEVFTRIFRSNRFQSADNAIEDLDSVSGPGSSLRQTATVRAELPGLLINLNVRSMLDVPCGDFNWMRTVDLGSVSYTGADIVRPLIESNNRRFATDRRAFKILDLTSDALPRVDLVLVRDCFIHLSYVHILAAVRGLRASGSEWLLTTTYPEHQRNRDIITGSFRPVNLEIPPFNFPRPTRLIRENPIGTQNLDKALGLWRISDLSGVF